MLPSIGVNCYHIFLLNKTNYINENILLWIDILKQTLTQVKTSKIGLRYHAKMLIKPSDVSICPGKNYVFPRQLHYIKTENVKSPEKQCCHITVKRVRSRQLLPRSGHGVGLSGEKAARQGNRSNQLLFHSKYIFFIPLSFSRPFDTFDFVHALSVLVGRNWQRMCSDFFLLLKCFLRSENGHLRPDRWYDAVIRSRWEWMVLVRRYSPALLGGLSFSKSLAPLSRALNSATSCNV